MDDHYPVRSAFSLLNKVLILFFHIFKMSSATVFLGYLRGICRYLRSHLISAVDFYCVINKLVILVYGSH
jgi:hypothetical protein